MATPALKVVTNEPDHPAQGVDIVLDTARPPRVEGGCVSVRFVTARRVKPFGREAMELEFEVVDGLSTSETGAVGERLKMHCKIGPGGRVSWSSKYARSWETAARRRPKRRDRMSTGIFAGKILQAAVRVVEKDAQGKPLAKDLRYSVIDMIVAVEAGS